MKVLITAGGTAEKIDSIRSVTNSGTGRLGAMCAERLAAYPTVSEIVYIHSAHSVLPDPIAGVDKITPVSVTDVDSLEQAVTRVCSGNDITAVIHSMAVSDYRVSLVTKLDNIEERASGGGISVVDAVRTARPASPGSKISSAHDDLVVLMEPTPKIIAMLRPMLPDALIIGFKLLSGVAEDELIAAAMRQIEANDCDYCLANDDQYIKRGEHIGHLVDREGNFVTYIGKDEIADALVRTVLGRSA